MPLRVAAIFLLAPLAALLACAQTKAGRTPSPSGMTVLEKHPKVDFAVSCFECHQGATPRITAQWESGKHGALNVGCFVCHGDGEVEFYAKPQGERCVSCHAEQQVDFTRLQVTSCFACHNGHDLKFHR